MTIFKAAGFPLHVAEIKRYRWEETGMGNQISNMFDWLYSRENYTTLGPVLFLYSINFT